MLAEDSFEISLGHGGNGGGLLALRGSGAVLVRDGAREFRKDFIMFICCAAEDIAGGSKEDDFNVCFLFVIVVLNLGVKLEKKSKFNIPDKQIPAG